MRAALINQDTNVTVIFGCVEVVGIWLSVDKYMTHPGVASTETVKTYYGIRESVDQCYFLNSNLFKS